MSDQMASVYIIVPMSNSMLTCLSLVSTNSQAYVKIYLPKLTNHKEPISDATYKYNMIHALNKYDTRIMK